MEYICLVCTRKTSQTPAAHFATHAKCPHCSKRTCRAAQKGQNCASPPDVAAPHFQCTECAYATNKLSNLKRHCQMNHKNVSSLESNDGSIPFICRVCDQLVSCKPSKHFSTHEKCPTCGSIACRHKGKECSVGERVKVKNGVWEKVIGCPDCAFTCKTVFKLRNHSKSHSDTPDEFKCAKCNFSSRLRKNLERHLKEKHPKADEKVTFECEDCDYTTARRENLQRHRNAKHGAGKTEPMRFVCEVCGTVLASVAAFRQHHIVKHSGREFKCNQCNKTYSSPQGLWVHQRMFHGKFKYVYHCPYSRCNQFKTNNKRKFMEHRASHVAEWANCAFKCPNDKCDFGAETKQAMSIHRAKCDKKIRRMKAPVGTSVIVQNATSSSSTVIVKNSLFAKDVNLEFIEGVVHPHVIVEHQMFSEQFNFEANQKTDAHDNNHQQTDYEFDTSLFNNGKCDLSVFDTISNPFDFDPHSSIDFALNPPSPESQNQMTFESDQFPVQRVKVIVNSDGVNSDVNPDATFDQSDFYPLPSVIVSPPHFRSSD